MEKNDEPVLAKPKGCHTGEKIESENTAKIIRVLLDSQSFCVLCTQGSSQPYGNLIAFAFTKDLKQLYFCTPRATRKFKLLTECGRAALVMDTRSRHTHDVTGIEAVTVTGKVRHLQKGDSYNTGINLLKNRHGYLKEFLESESTALFLVEADRYIHVARFQEVTQWIP